MIPVGYSRRNPFTDKSCSDWHASAERFANGYEVWLQSELLIVERFACSTETALNLIRN